MMSTRMRLVALFFMVVLVLLTLTYVVIMQMSMQKAMTTHVAKLQSITPPPPTVEVHHHHYHEAREPILDMDLVNEYYMTTPYSQYLKNRLTLMYGAVITRLMLPWCINARKQFFDYYEEKGPYRGILVYAAVVDFYDDVQRPQHIMKSLCGPGRFFCLWFSDLPPLHDDVPPIHENPDLRLIAPHVFFTRDIRCMLYDLKDLKVVLYLNYPYVAYLPSLLPNAVSWYDAIDNLRLMCDVTDDLILNSHVRLVMFSDIYSVSALGLKMNNYGASRKDTLYLPNAGHLVDRKKIDEITEVPSDIAEIVKSGKPIIGYWGVMAGWFPSDMISLSAQANPDWHFVLIGNGYPPILTQIPNIHCLGRKEYKVLPTYGKYFDVALSPFRMDSIGHAVSPLKFFEYAAMGIPIVATDIYELRQYADDRWIFLASTANELSDAIKKALKSKENARLLSPAFMQNHTWEARAATFMDKYEEVYKKKLKKDVDVYKEVK